jgi:uncharacterized membrane protein YqjE
MVDSRPIASESKGEVRRIKPRVYGYALAVVFVAAVVTMAVKDGASGAAVTTLLAFALLATAVGVWGTAMAVKETEHLGSRTDD